MTTACRKVRFKVHSAKIEVETDVFWRVVEECGEIILSAWWADYHPYVGVDVAKITVDGKLKLLSMKDSPPGVDISRDLRKIKLAK